ncbi:MAG: prolyl-tRNA synthetase associated domain-containing protein [Bacteroidales bacterium]|nr:prolyl-tRNA synthetase associated domain-containing protein [Candidatus Cacconaster equi]
MDVVRKVRDFLERNGIWYEIHFHPPLFTIEQALEYWKDIDAVHCKNLFMRNHKGNRHYMVSFECHKDLDIHSLEHSLHQGKLSFASPERMDRCLGLRPGSVSPFGLINDIGLTDNSGKAKDGVKESELFENGHRVKLYLDADLRNAERVSFHPCDNTASVVITHDGLMKFLELWGGEVEWLEITPAPTAQASASL